jgi:peptidoglycan hydrolase-like protein with peptidoglycan-binding domain
MGPQTQKALKEFQQSKNLEASGQLDQETLAALGVESGSGSAAGATSGSSEKSGSAASGASTEQSGKSEKSESEKKQ